MPYDFTNKDNQRSAIVNMFQRCAAKRDVVFLDDEHAGACNAFLEAGIPKSHLKPVNSSTECCRLIKRRSGIPCSCYDIDEYIAELDDDSCSVVWVDYMKTEMDLTTLRHAIRVSPYVSVTLSLRKVSRHGHLDDIRKLVKRAGGEMTAYTTYKGASGIMNMMCFNVERRSMEEVVTTKKGSEVVQSKTIKKKPIHPSFRVNDRVVVKWGKVNLTAIVTGSSQTHAHVVFDCDGVKKPVAKGRVSLNPVSHSPRTLNSMVGRTIHMPVKLWGRDLAAYDGVQRCGRHMVFSIVERKTNSDRYRIAAVDASTGKTMKGSEKWTLTYDQAACHVK